MTNCGFPHAFRTVVESLCIHDEHSFSLFGERHETERPDRAIATHSVLTPEALTLLGHALYESLHCRVPRDHPHRHEPLVDLSGSADFSRLLSEANSGTGTWQGGWTFHHVEADGRIIAERFGVRFWIPPSEVGDDLPGTEAGREVRVRMPKEYQHLNEGFYTALGDLELDLESTPAVRVYWHIRARGAVALTAHLTTMLNERSVPFLLKICDDPLRFVRSDAAVLYVARDRYREATPVITAVHGQLREYLRDETSEYVKRLGPGLGAADDPGDGSSFGQHRSTLVAAALAESGAGRSASAGDWAAAALAVLRRDGYDPAALFLNPGAVDQFEPIDGGTPRAAE